MPSSKKKIHNLTDSELADELERSVYFPEEKFECPCCLKSKRGYGALQIAACRHAFCPSCAHKWFVKENKTTCPMCREGNLSERELQRLTQQQYYKRWNIGDLVCGSAQVYDDYALTDEMRGRKKPIFITTDGNTVFLVDAAAFSKLPSVLAELNLDHPEEVTKLRLQIVRGKYCDFSNFSQPIEDYFPNLTEISLRHVNAKNFQLHMEKLELLKLVGMDWEEDSHDEIFDLKLPSLTELKMDCVIPPVEAFADSLQNCPNIRKLFSYKYQSAKEFPTLYLPRCEEVSFYRCCDGIPRNLSLFIPRAKKVKLFSNYALESIAVLDTWPNTLKAPTTLEDDKLNDEEPTKFKLLLDEYSPKIKTWIKSNPRIADTKATLDFTVKDSDEESDDDESDFDSEVDSEEEEEEDFDVDHDEDMEDDIDFEEGFSDGEEGAILNGLNIGGRGPVGVDAGEVGIEALLQQLGATGGGINDIPTTSSNDVGGDATAHYSPNMMMFGQQNGDSGEEFSVTDPACFGFLKEDECKKWWNKERPKLNRDFGPRPSPNVFGEYGKMHCIGTKLRKTYHADEDDPLKALGLGKVGGREEGSDDSEDGSSDSNEDDKMRVDEYWVSGSLFMNTHMAMGGPNIPQYVCWKPEARPGAHYLAMEEVHHNPLIEVVSVNDEAEIKRANQLKQVMEECHERYFQINMREKKRKKRGMMMYSSYHDEKNKVEYTDVEHLFLAEDSTTSEEYFAVSDALGSAGTCQLVNFPVNMSWFFCLDPDRAEDEEVRDISFVRYGGSDGKWKKWGGFQKDRAGKAVEENKVKERAAQLEAKYRTWRSNGGGVEEVGITATEQQTSYAASSSASSSSSESEETDINAPELKRKRKIVQLGKYDEGKSYLSSFAYKDDDGVVAFVPVNQFVFMHGEMMHEDLKLRNGWKSEGQYKQ